MHVSIINGAVFVFFDTAPSVSTGNMLKACGFKSRFGTIWEGTKDDLFRTTLPASCKPPMHAALWPDTWTSLVGDLT
jgi:hypothetical protein